MTLKFLTTIYLTICVCMTPHSVFGKPCEPAEFFDGIVNKLTSGACQGIFSIGSQGKRMVPENLPVEFQKDGLRVKGCANRMESKPCESLGVAIDTVHLTKIQRSFPDPVHSLIGGNWEVTFDWHCDGKAPFGYGSLKFVEKENIVYWSNFPSGSTQVRFWRLTDDIVQFSLYGRPWVGVVKGDSIKGTAHISSANFCWTAIRE